MSETQSAEQNEDQPQAQADSPRHITQEELENADAAVLRDHAMPGYLFACTSLISKGMTHGGFKSYLDNLLAESGSPHDPIEKMLIEQLALAHHNIGRLHVKSSAVDSHQESVAYAAAATRLTAEYRRLASAIQDYRAKSRSTLGIVRHETEAEEHSEPERQASIA
jgi:hypothetical protein